MNGPSDPAQPEQKPEAASIPLLEWIAGGLGLLVVAAVVGVLCYEAIAGDKSPPDVKLTVQSIAPRQSGFLIKIRAGNVGGEPAANVDITAELREAGEVVEESGMQFAHLPPHSSREGGVFFQKDPRGGEIRLQVKGYEDP